MKLEERQQSIELRKKGFTYAEITEQLNVSKSSLSGWLRNVSYNPSESSLKKRRLASVRNGKVNHYKKLLRVKDIKTFAKSEVQKLKEGELKLLGIMAYWCEGSKTRDSLVQFTNSGPRLIKLMVKWFKLSCDVPESVLRVRVYLHANINPEKAKEYWSKITKVPLSQFYQVTLKSSRSRGKRIKQLPYGVASIVVCDTKLFYQIQAWTEQLSFVVNGA